MTRALMKRLSEFHWFRGRDAMACGCGINTSHFHTSHFHTRAVAIRLTASSL